MPSYQEIETRLQAVERKLDFVMKSFSSVVPSKLGGPPQHLTMLDLYYESEARGSNVKKVDS